jgi:phospholipid transport system substrate-binding protein
MHLTNKGWKVYDVSIEGVSMVTTYRTSFAAEIKQKGLDGLIASLTERNVKLARKDS